MTRYVCELSNGQRVGFSLKQRERDPYYLVAFRGPDGRPKERSTKEPNKKRATDSAVVLIRSVYDPQPAIENPSWEEALELLKERMEAKNLRPATIDDYGFAIVSLRKVFPKTYGPEEITQGMAETYKSKRLSAGRSSYTVAVNLNTLKVIYGCWWIRVCNLLRSNPFENVVPPKTDKLTPRFIKANEMQAFLDWLSHEWDGWRLPILFLEIKALVGCRISELAAAKTAGLTDRRITFEAETTKGRKERAGRLPASVFTELNKIAGPHFVFETYSSGLRQIYLKRSQKNYAKSVRNFAPGRLKNWIERQAARYFKRHPKAIKFKLHNFRGTAMSKARMADINVDDGAIAFGCHPETMRKHYLALEEKAISDRVMDSIQNLSEDGEESGTEREEQDEAQD